MIKKDITAVILAAGKSTRMVSDIPKVLHNIVQQPLLEYVIKIGKFCAQKIVAVVNEELSHHKLFLNLVDKYKVHRAIQAVQLGTADAVKSAMPYVNSEYTLILCGDVPFIEEATIERMCAEKTDLVILGFDFHTDDHHYGRIVIDDYNRPIKVVETKDAKGQELKITLCNSGTMLVKTSILKDFLNKVENNNKSKEYYLTDLTEFIYRYKNFYKSSLIKASNYHEVIGINDKLQLAFAEKVMQEKLRDNVLASGAILIDPSTVFLTHSTKIERDTIIHPFVFFGNDVHIESNVTILSFCHIEGAKISKGSVVGPFARIRPETVIQENTRIGNFVEIKNAVLGDHAKACHLSYIGDVTIGEHVNIGAGTIFCNYDGQKKHYSIVGKNSFIGSNSCIISPIKIDENVLVGAGSVVTQDVPAHHLAIARARQKNIKRKVIR